MFNIETREQYALEAHKVMIWNVFDKVHRMFVIISIMNEHMRQYSSVNAKSDRVF
jgi:hypothetical protein